MQAILLRSNFPETAISLITTAVRVRLLSEERRYEHYVSDRREPDLGTLVKIADALRTTPNLLLGVTVPVADDPKKAILLERLSNPAATMSLEGFKIFVFQAEAIADESQKNLVETRLENRLIHRDTITRLG